MAAANGSAHGPYATNKTAFKATLYVNRPYGVSFARAVLDLMSAEVRNWATDVPCPLLAPSLLPPCSLLALSLLSPYLSPFLAPLPPSSM